MDWLIGQRLRARRLERGIDEARFSSALGVEVATLVLYEGGEARVPADRLFLACRALALTPAALFASISRPDCARTEVARSNL